MLLVQKLTKSNFKNKIKSIINYNHPNIPSYIIFFTKDNKTTKIIIHIKITHDHGFAQFGENPNPDSLNIKMLLSSLL